MNKADFIDRIITAPVKVELFLDYFEGDYTRATRFLVDLHTFKTVQQIKPVWAAHIGYIRTDGDSFIWQEGHIAIPLYPPDFIEAVPYRRVEELLHQYPGGFSVAANGEVLEVVLSTSNFQTVAAKVPIPANQGYQIVKPTQINIGNRKFEWLESPDPEERRRRANRIADGRAYKHFGRETSLRDD